MWYLSFLNQEDGMISVADKEKSLGFLGVVGVGVAAYAFKRGWRKLSGAGALTSLAVIIRCVQSHLYRAPLRAFRKDAELEAKLKSIQLVPKDLLPEAFGHPEKGWLAENLGGVVDDDKMARNRALFEAVLDHILGSEELIDDNLENVCEHIDRSAKHSPAYLSIIAAKVLATEEPLDYLFAELLDYATDEQKAAFADKHKKTIEKHLDEFWLQVFAYQHCPDLKEQAKGRIESLNLPEDAKKGSHWLKESFDFNAAAFNVLNELNMLKADLCQELYDTREVLDRWAAAYHHFKLTGGELALLKQACGSLSPNMTLASALAADDEFFAAVMQESPHKVYHAADGVDCPALWSKLRDNPEHFRTAFADYMYRNWGPNHLGEYLCRPAFFEAVIDPTDPVNSEFGEAMKCASSESSDKLTEKQREYMAAATDED